LVALGLQSATAYSQIPKSGFVTAVQGTATVMHPSSPLRPLSYKDNVFLGDRITTSAESLVRILLGSKAVVTIRELSILTLSEKDGRSVLMLDGGIIAYVVPRDRMQPGEIHEIRTPNAIARVVGTVAVVGVDRDIGVPRVTTICALTGTVSASAVGGAEIQVGKNQCVAVTGDRVGPVFPFSPLR
jgi:FecR protein